MNSHWWPLEAFLRIDAYVGADSVRTFFSWLATRTSVRYLQIELSPISDSQQGQVPYLTYREDGRLDDGR
jgi:hypothetical protein